MNSYVHLIMILASTCLFQAEASMIVSPITVSASAFVPAGDTTEQRDLQTILASYTVMFTGDFSNRFFPGDIGTMGFFTPAIDVQGETNEDLMHFFGSGGVASAAIKASSTVGVFSMKIQTGPNPRPHCGDPSEQCQLPFTVGVPITLDVTLTASADWGIYRNPPNNLSSAVQASASFSGIANVYDSRGIALPASPDQVTITLNQATPEPATFGFMALALLCMSQLPVIMESQWLSAVISKLRPHVGWD